MFVCFFFLISIIICCNTASCFLEMITHFFLSFSPYWTRLCLTMMAGVSVARKLHKNKKKITIQIFDEATSVEIIYKQSSGTGIPSHVPAQHRSLYFGLKPVNCLHRDRFGCKSILSCSCPGKERKFQPVRICIRTVILKGVWYSCYLQSVTYIQYSGSVMSGGQ